MPENLIRHQSGGYARLHENFRWSVPDHFNMAEVCCRRWASDAETAHRTAVREYLPQAEPRLQSHSYARLQEQANRLSNALVGLGNLQSL